MDAAAHIAKLSGYTFTDEKLLRTALTHRSLARESDHLAHNQRLEFLGDSVLGLCVADMLYAMYPNADEGDLSKRLVALVNGERLARIAREMKLGELLLLSDGEEEQGGRDNPSNLEDACEALLGALYLDGGLAAVRPVIEHFWKPLAQSQEAAPKDPKTTLQEWAQGKGHALPEYVVLSSEGPAHAPHFVIEVRVDGKSAKGEAKTKKHAERAAAEAMLSQLSE